MLASIRRKEQHVRNCKIIIYNDDDYDVGWRMVWGGGVEE